MQKWEYLTAFLAPQGKDQEFVISRENWKPLFSKGMGIIPNFKNCPTWSDYLMEKGEEGWELIGFSAVSLSGNVIAHAVFKRPKEG